MMNDTYTTVTITTALRDRIGTLRDRLTAAAAKKPHKANPALLKGKVSITDILGELCFRVERDLARSKRHGAEKRQAARDKHNHTTPPE